MPEHAKGGKERLEEEHEERHRVVPETETMPTPAKKRGCLLRSAPASIIGTCNDLAAHHAISHSPNAVWLFVQYCSPQILGRSSTGQKNLDLVQT